MSKVCQLTEVWNPSNVVSTRSTNAASVGHVRCVLEFIWCSSAHIVSHSYGCAICLVLYVSHLCRECTLPSRRYWTSVKWDRLLCDALNLLQLQLTDSKAVDREFLRTNCVVSCCQMVHKQIYCKTLISENFLDIRALQFFLLFCKKWAWRGADEVDSNLAAKLSWVVDKNTNNALVPFSNLLNLEPEPSCIEDIPICSLRVSAKRLNLSHITLYFIQSEDCI